MVASFTYSVAWDSAPVRQSFGESRVVFDGVVSVTSPRGQIWEYRVNVSATRGGRKPEFMLRYMTGAKRGHAVPENHLAYVREYLAGAAVEHLADYRAAFVAECRERDSGGAPASQPVDYAMNDGTNSAGAPAAPLKLDNAEALSAQAAPVRTIDLTPTWAAVLPLLIAGLENGTATGRKIAREELQRMAAMADKYVAAQKALSEITGKESN